MLPWIKQWEYHAQASPEQVAIVDDMGHEYRYGELRERAHELSHRWSLMGVGSGDGIGLAWMVHYALDDRVVAAWACGLLNAPWTPLPQSQALTQRLAFIEKLNPRLLADPLHGQEEVRAPSGLRLHDTAFVWPERALHGVERSISPWVLRPVKSDAFNQSLLIMQSCLQWGKEDRMVLADRHLLMPLSWLCISQMLCQGGCIVQAHPSLLTAPELLEGFCQSRDISWLCACPEWLAHAEEVIGSLKGVVAPWGEGSMALRHHWSRCIQWWDVFSSSLAGWWALAHRVEPSESACADLMPFLQKGRWKMDAKRRFLHTQTDQGWQAVAQLGWVEGKCLISPSGLATASDRLTVDNIVASLREFGRFGDLVVFSKDNQVKIGVLSRSRHENSLHVVREAMVRARGVYPDALSDYQWIALPAYAARDEAGFLMPPWDIVSY